MRFLFSILIFLTRPNVYGKVCFFSYLAMLINFIVLIFTYSTEKYSTTKTKCLLILNGEEVKLSAIKWVFFCHNLQILMEKKYLKISLIFTFFPNDYKCTVAIAYLITVVNEIVYDTLGLITLRQNSLFNYYFFKHYVVIRTLVQQPNGFTEV